MDAIIQFGIKLFVHDEFSVRAFAGMPASTVAWAPFEDALRATVLNPAPPIGAGYRLLPNAEVRRLHYESRGATWFILVKVEVLDAPALMEEARTRYRACWADDSWMPASLEEAMYEILVASNASPAPMDLGFELYDNFPKDSSLEPTQSPGDASRG